MSARAWTLFAAVSVIWGMPYLFIKIAVEEISPSLVAWSRLAIAAAVLLPVAWRLGALRGPGRALEDRSPSSPPSRWRCRGRCSASARCT